MSRLNLWINGEQVGILEELLPHNWVPTSKV